MECQEQLATLKAQIDQICEDWDVPMIRQDGHAYSVIERISQALKQAQPEERELWKGIAQQWKLNAEINAESAAQAREVLATAQAEK